MHGSLGFTGVADKKLPRRIRRPSEGELRGLVFELAMEHALLQTWTGYPKELTTACKLFGVNLKSVEAKVRKALKDADQNGTLAEASARYGDRRRNPGELTIEVRRGCQCPFAP